MINPPANDVPSNAVRPDAVTAAARDWVVRLASGEMSEADMAAFRAWHGAGRDHAAAFERERRFWRDLGALQGGRGANIARPAFRRRGAVAAGLLAACLAFVLALGGGIWPFAPSAEIAVAEGAQREVALPDGSTAVLNTDTAVNLRFGAAERVVELISGEALFQVRPDKARPFRVLAGGGMTEAVGTAFVVRSVGGETTVTVTEGIVRVTAPAGSGEGQRVTHGQRTEYRAGGVPGAVAAADAGAATAWRRGLIVIDGLPLDAAVAELDRYRPGRILLLGGGGFERVSGAFDIDKVDAALQGLAATHGLKVTRLGPYLTILR